MFFHSGKDGRDLRVRLAGGKTYKYECKSGQCGVSEISNHKNRMSPVSNANLADIDLIDLFAFFTDAFFDADDLGVRVTAYFADALGQMFAVR